MDNERKALSKHLAANQGTNRNLGFSYKERLENHRKRFGLMLLPLSWLMSCALGMGLLPLLDPNVGNMPWVRDYLLGAVVWGGLTLVVWGALAWLSVSLWKFGIFLGGCFILSIARAESGGKAVWILTPTGMAGVLSILGASYLLWGHYMPLVLGRRREPASPDPSERDVNDSIARVAGPVAYEALAEANTIRFVYERVVPEPDEKVVAFHDAGLRTSWVLTTRRLHYFNGDSRKERGTINFDDVTQWRVSEGTIFVTIEFVMNNGETIEVDDLLETPPFHQTNRGIACRGEHGGHLIKCRCPFCKARLNGVTKEMTGDIGLCPKCRREFTIESTDKNRTQSH